MTGKGLSIALLLWASLCFSGKSPAELGKDWVQATQAAVWTPRLAHGAVSFDGKIWVIGGFGSFYSSLGEAIWHSADGVSWTTGTPPTIVEWRSGHSTLVYNGKIWVIGGRYRNYDLVNDVWYSSDGAKWTSATLSAPWLLRSDHTSVVHNGRIWVLGGQAGSDMYATPRNDVWYSPPPPSVPVRPWRPYR